MASIRIVTADHYMSTPIEGLDPVYSEFRGSSVGQVPVIRIFGTTKDGVKTCLHVHGVLPYLFIPFSGVGDSSALAYQLASSIDKALNILQGNKNSNTQHVYKITLVSGKPIYGFHKKEHQYFKIFFYNWNMRDKAVSLLQNGAVCNQVFQPHEAHVPYILQFFIDYNLYGMSFIEFSSVKYRQSEENSAYLAGVDENLILKSTACSSFSKLEIDGKSVDILNYKSISGTNLYNPGIAAIWEDEKRRRNVEDKSEIAPPCSQVRTCRDYHRTETMYKQKLREKLQRLGFDKKEPRLTPMSASYPAETPDNADLLSASFLEPVVSLHSATAGETIINEYLDETIVDEQVVFNLSQWSNSQPFSEKDITVNTQDAVLLETLETLAKNQKVGISSQSLDRENSQLNLSCSQRNLNKSSQNELELTLTQRVDDDSILGTQFILNDPKDDPHEEDAQEDLSNVFNNAEEEGISHETSPKIIIVEEKLLEKIESVLPSATPKTSESPSKGTQCEKTEEANAEAEDDESLNWSQNSESKGPDIWENSFGPNISKDDIPQLDGVQDSFNEDSDASSENQKVVVKIHAQDLRRECNDAFNRDIFHPERSYTSTYSSIRLPFSVSSPKRRKIKTNYTNINKKKKNKWKLSRSLFAFNESMISSGSNETESSSNNESETTFSTSPSEKPLEKDELLLSLDESAICDIIGVQSAHSSFQNLDSLRNGLDVGTKNSPENELIVELPDNSIDMNGVNASDADSWCFDNVEDFNERCIDQANVTNGSVLISGNISPQHFKWYSLRNSTVSNTVTVNRKKAADQLSIKIKKPSKTCISPNSLTTECFVDLSRDNVCTTTFLPQTVVKERDDTVHDSEITETLNSSLSATSCRTAISDSFSNSNSTQAEKLTLCQNGTLEEKPNSSKPTNRHKNLVTIVADIHREGNKQPLPFDRKKRKTLRRQLKKMRAEFSKFRSIYSQNLAQRESLLYEIVKVPLRLKNKSSRRKTGRKNQRPKKAQLFVKRKSLHKKRLRARYDSIFERRSGTSNTEISPIKELSSKRQEESVPEKIENCDKSVLVQERKLPGICEVSKLSPAKEDMVESCSKTSVNRNIFPLKECSIVLHRLPEKYSSVRNCLPHCSSKSVNSIPLSVKGGVAPTDDGVSMNYPTPRPKIVPKCNILLNQVRGETNRPAKGGTVYAVGNKSFTAEDLVHRNSNPNGRTLIFVVRPKSGISGENVRYPKRSRCLEKGFIPANSYAEPNGKQFQTPGNSIKFCTQSNELESAASTSYKYINHRSNLSTSLGFSLCNQEQLKVQSNLRACENEQVIEQQSDQGNSALKLAEENIKSSSNKMMSRVENLLKDNISSIRPSLSKLSENGNNSTNSQCDSLKNAQFFSLANVKELKIICEKISPSASPVSSCSYRSNCSVTHPLPVRSYNTAKNSKSLSPKNHCNIAVSNCKTQLSESSTSELEANHCLENGRPQKLLENIPAGSSNVIQKDSSLILGINLKNNQDFAVKKAESGFVSSTPSRFKRNHVDSDKEYVQSSKEIKLPKNTAKKLSTSLSSLAQPKSSISKTYCRKKHLKEESLLKSEGSEGCDPCVRRKRLSALTALRKITEHSDEGSRSKTKVSENVNNLPSQRTKQCKMSPECQKNDSRSLANSCTSVVPKSSPEITNLHSAVSVACQTCEDELSPVTMDRLNDSRISIPSTSTDQSLIFGGIEASSSTSNVDCVTRLFRTNTDQPVISLCLLLNPINIANFQKIPNFSNLMNCNLDSSSSVMNNFVSLLSHKITTEASRFINSKSPQLAINNIVPSDKKPHLLGKRKSQNKENYSSNSLKNGSMDDSDIVLKKSLKEYGKCRVLIKRITTTTNSMGNDSVVSCVSDGASTAGSEIIHSQCFDLLKAEHSSSHVHSYHLSLDGNFDVSSDTSDEDTPEPEMSQNSVQRTPLKNYQFPDFSDFSAYASPEKTSLSPKQKIKPKVSGLFKCTVVLKPIVRMNDSKPSILGATASVSNIAVKEVKCRKPITSSQEQRRTISKQKRYKGVVTKKKMVGKSRLNLDKNLDGKLVRLQPIVKLFKLDYEKIKNGISASHADYFLPVVGSLPTSSSQKIRPRRYNYLEDALLWRI